VLALLLLGARDDVSSPDAGRQLVEGAGALSDLAQIVAETVPNCTIEYAPGGGPDKRCYRVNCNKIRAALPEFETQWTARRGAGELFEAYTHNHLRADQIPTFSRLAEIRSQIAAGLLNEDLLRQPERSNDLVTAGREVK